MFLNYPGCPPWLLQVCTNVVVPGGDLFSVLGTWSSCVWWESDQDVATSAGLTVPMSATSCRPCDEAVTPVPACFCQQAPVFTSSPPLCWVLVWRSQLDQGDDQSRLWRSRVRHHPFTYAQLSRHMWPSSLDGYAHEHMWARSLLAWTTLFIICRLVFGAKPKVRLESMVGRRNENICEDWP